MNCMVLGSKGKCGIVGKSVLDIHNLLLFNCINFIKKVAHNFSKGYQLVVEFACCICDQLRL